MPEIQAVLVGILREIIAVCAANGIPYCLIGGGCLGIVRHGGGFVPWDDDLDIAVWAADMPRLVAALSALPGHLAVRPRSDEPNPTYLVMDARTETVGSGLGEERVGIFIDIVPMMLWRSPRWKAIDRTLERLRRLQWNEGSSRAVNAAKHVLFLARAPGLAAWLGDRHFYPLVRRLDARCREAGRGVVTAPDRRVWVGSYDHDTVLPPQEASFCGVPVAVPRDLHTFLARRYGLDYMQPPPEAARWKHFAAASRIAE